MSPTEINRLKWDWYNRRIMDNTEVKAFLIEKIMKSSPSFMNAEALIMLKNEDLLELAIGSVNDTLEIIHAVKGKDFSNGMDAKFCIVRTNSYGRSYSAAIKLKNKNGILALIYERIQNKFYPFAFPVLWTEASIPFDIETGEPKRSNHMWQYECKSFEEMCHKTFEGLFDEV
jgi:hypothetical protein